MEFLVLVTLPIWYIVSVYSLIVIDDLGLTNNGYQNSLKKSVPKTVFASPNFVHHGGTKVVSPNAQHKVVQIKSLPQYKFPMNVPNIQTTLQSKNFRIKNHQPQQNNVVVVPVVEVVDEVPAAEKSLREVEQRIIRKKQYNHESKDQDVELPLYVDEYLEPDTKSVQKPEVVTLTVTKTASTKINPMTSSEKPISYYSPVTQSASSLSSVPASIYHPITSIISPSIASTSYYSYQPRPVSSTCLEEKEYKSRQQPSPPPKSTYYQDNSPKKISYEHTLEHDLGIEDADSARKRFVQKKVEVSRSNQRKLDQKLSDLRKIALELQDKWTKLEGEESKAKSESTNYKAKYKNTKELITKTTSEIEDNDAQTRLSEIEILRLEKLLSEEKNNLKTLEGQKALYKDKLRHLETEEESASVKLQNYESKVKIYSRIRNELRQEIEEVSEKISEVEQLRAHEVDTLNKLSIAMDEDEGDKHLSFFARYS